MSETEYAPLGYIWRLKIIPGSLVLQEQTAENVWEDTDHLPEGTTWLVREAYRAGLKRGTDA